MVNAPDFQPKGWWFKPGLCCRVISLERNSAPCCLFLLRCINGCQRYDAGGGQPCDGLASHPGGSSTTLSCLMLQKLG